jgi:hypothetical protein
MCNKDGRAKRSGCRQEAGKRVPGGRGEPSRGTRTLSSAR